MKLSNQSYDRLKKVAQIWLPALGSAYFSLAGIWHLPNAEQVVGTIVILDTFLGTVLHINTQNYNKSDRKYDGEFDVVPGEDGSELHLKQADVEALLTKDEVVFKLNKAPKVESGSKS